MSLPPLVPEQSASGITVDPNTLDRVVPATRRADGSVRKELKIRPGFTPQEDVSRFRGSRQQAADRSALPKGHIMGWVPPSAETKPKPKIKPGNSLAAAAAAAAADTAGLSKAQKKNAKRAEKRAEKKAEAREVKENWDDDDDDDEKGDGKELKPVATVESTSKASEADVDAVTKEIEQLNV